MVDVIVDGVGPPKGGCTDSIGPIQMPVFPCWIHIGIGTNNTDNLSISLRRSKIVCTCN